MESTAQSGQNAAAGASFPAQDQQQSNLNVLGASNNAGTASGSGNSPVTGNGSMGGPGSNGFPNRRFAPEPNKRALYVGGLDSTVTEEFLREMFDAAVGHVVSIKLIPEKGNRAKGCYAFIEFDDPAAAEQAMVSLNGRVIKGTTEMKINWAYQSSNPAPKPDTSQDSHVFVGDLSNEVTDEILLQAFSAFGPVSEARVMWDMKTGRSRGYGFVAYPNRDHADKAIQAMSGEWLGSRAIRCNWANQKGQPPIGGHSQQMDMSQMQGNNFGQNFNFPAVGGYDVASQTPQWQTTCYVGNLTPYTTENDLVPLFRNFGYVMQARLQPDRGFAFIKMDTHETAAAAIVQLNGYNLNGRPLKVSWGKDRPPNGQYDGYNNRSNQSGFPQNNVGYFPQYNGINGPINSQGPTANNQQFPIAGNGFPQGNNPNGMQWGGVSNGQNGFGYNNVTPMN